MLPTSTRFTFRTARQVPRLGVMLVGWGGNNGSTLTAAVLANRLRLSWPTRTGRKVGGVGRSTEKLGLCWSPYRRGRGLRGRVLRERFPRGWSLRWGKLPEGTSGWEVASALACN